MTHILISHACYAHSHIEFLDSIIVTLFGPMGEYSPEHHIFIHHHLKWETKIHIHIKLWNYSILYIIWYGEWKSRTNRELEGMCKGENTVKWIKGQRISWLGCLERMEEDMMPKKIFTEEVEGARRRGRHRKRWKEEVGRDSSAGSEKMDRVGSR